MLIIYYLTCIYLIYLKHWTNIPILVMNLDSSMAKEKSFKVKSQMTRKGTGTRDRDIRILGIFHNFINTINTLALIC